MLSYLEIQINVCILKRVFKWLNSIFYSTVCFDTALFLCVILAVYFCV